MEENERIEMLRRERRYTNLIIYLHAMIQRGEMNMENFKFGLRKFCPWLWEETVSRKIERT